MHPDLRQLLGLTRQHDLITASNRTLDASSPLEPDRVVIRIATAADRRSLEHLAELDSAAAPVGPTLIGELRGRPVAALSLGDGRAIADPFVATSDILELLRLRAGQLDQRLALDARSDRSAGWTKAVPHRRPPGSAKRRAGAIA
jgi:hypothetical protein